MNSIQAFARLLDKGAEQGAYSFVHNKYKFLRNWWDETETFTFGKYFCITFVDANHAWHVETRCVNSGIVIRVQRSIVLDVKSEWPYTRSIILRCKEVTGRRYLTVELYEVTESLRRRQLIYSHVEMMVFEWPWQLLRPMLGWRLLTFPCILILEITEYSNSGLWLRFNPFSMRGCFLWRVVYLHSQLAGTERILT